MTRILIAAAAQSRGFRNPLAFRRWCKSHGVELLRDGRRLWVSPADIDAALDRIAKGPAPSNDARVLSVVESLKNATTNRQHIHQGRDSTRRDSDLARQREGAEVGATLPHDARRVADVRGGRAASGE